MGQNLWYAIPNTVSCSVSLTEQIPGDLVYVDAIGQPILIVNSANVALDLMDKRSTVYSDRPHLASHHLLSEI